MINLTRRRFLFASAAIVAAPSLMRVSSRLLPKPKPTDYTMLLPGPNPYMSAEYGSGESVRLPPAQPRLQVTIMNRGKAPLRVFTAAEESISRIDEAVSSVVQVPNSVTNYVCFGQGQWFTEGLVRNLASADQQEVLLIT